MWYTSANMDSVSWKSWYTFKLREIVSPAWWYIVDGRKSNHQNGDTVSSLGKSYHETVIHCGWSEIVSPDGDTVSSEGKRITRRWYIVDGRKSYHPAAIQFQVRENVSRDGDTLWMVGNRITRRRYGQQCFTKMMIHSMRIIKLLEPHTRRPSKGTRVWELVYKKWLRYIR